MIETDRETRVFQKLHNATETEPWPEGAERGDTWFTFQVYTCPVCGGKTNRVIMGGWPGTGPRRICPNACEKWHGEIEEMFSQLNQPGHPKSYLHALKNEITARKNSCKNLVKDDLQGDPDLSQADNSTIVSGGGR